MKKKERIATEILQMEKQRTAFWRAAAFIMAVIAIVAVVAGQEGRA